MKHVHMDLKCMQGYFRPIKNTITKKGFQIDIKHESNFERDAMASLQ